MKEIIGRKVKRSDKIIKVTPDILKQINEQSNEYILNSNNIDMPIEKYELDSDNNNSFEVKDE